MEKGVGARTSSLYSTSLSRRASFLQFLTTIPARLFRASMSVPQQLRRTVKVGRDRKSFRQFTCRSPWCLLSASPISDRRDEERGQRTMSNFTGECISLEAELLTDESRQKLLARKSKQCNGSAVCLLFSTVDRQQCKCSFMFIICVEFARLMMKLVALLPRRCKISALPPPSLSLGKEISKWPPLQWLWRSVLRQPLYGRPIFVRNIVVTVSCKIGQTSHFVVCKLQASPPDRTVGNPTLWRSCCLELSVVTTCAGYGRVGGRARTDSKQ